MTTTMLCWRCGTDMHLISEETEASFDVRIVPHVCYRFMVAEFWENGEITACWTSDVPGKTGPDDFIRHHRQAADEGWKLPEGGTGWTYRWQMAFAGVEW